MLLAWLANSISESTPKKTYKFVAFGAEEKGLVGSRALVESLSAKEVANACAMVNFDSFGFAEAWALRSISSRELMLLAAEVKRERGGSFSIRNYRGASSDSKSFKEAGVPAITLTGIEKNWRDFLHKEADVAENINFRSVWSGFKFARAFLKRIDEVPCKSLR